MLPNLCNKNHNFSASLQPMLKILKITITYNLLILVLFAYNYKTINYYLGLTNSQAVFTHSFDCEEKDTNSKKLDEKSVKKDLHDFMNADRTHSFVYTLIFSFKLQYKSLYSSSDHSLSVYSPPDFTAI